MARMGRHEVQFSAVEEDPQAVVRERAKASGCPLQFLDAAVECLALSVRDLVACIGQ